MTRRRGGKTGIEAGWTDRGDGNTTSKIAGRAGSRSEGAFSHHAQPPASDPNSYLRFVTPPWRDSRPARITIYFLLYPFPNCSAPGLVATPAAHLLPSCSPFVSFARRSRGPRSIPRSTLLASSPTRLQSVSSRRLNSRRMQEPVRFFRSFSRPIGRRGSQVRSVPRVLATFLPRESRVRFYGFPMLDLPSANNDKTMIPFWIAFGASRSRRSTILTKKRGAVLEGIFILRTARSKRAARGNAIHSRGPVSTHDGQRTKEFPAPRQL